MSTNNANLYKLSCDSTTGRQLLPVPVNSFTNQVTVELGYEGTLFLSEITWKQGPLPLNVTTMEVLRRISSSQYVVVSLKNHFKL